MMVLIGGFQIIAGLVAIIGIVVLLGGLGLLQRKLWAGALAIGLAMLSAIANFFFIPYYPFWSIVMIALAVFVIWSITRPGTMEA